MKIYLSRPGASRVSIENGDNVSLGQMIAEANITVPSGYGLFDIRGKKVLASSRPEDGATYMVAKTQQEAGK